MEQVSKFRKFHNFIFLVVATLAQTTYAGTRDNPDPIPGWVNSGNQQGLILSGADVTYSSPAVADIDGDLTNGLETAVGGADGILYVYKSDGSLLWSAALPNYTCAKASSNNKLLSSPAVGQLYGNGMPYVVVGYGGVGGRACDGGIAAFRGSDGAQEWVFSLQQFAKKAKFGTNSHAVFSSPALADTDGDGKLEVGFGSFDRNVYLLNADGSVRWYYNAADTIWSSPAFANIDSDPDLEMIIGTDISGNSRLKPITKDGGYVYAFKTKSRGGKRIAFRDRSAYVWQASFDQVIYSSPVVADVLPGGGNEIIIGSGCFFPQRSNNKRGKWVKILRASDGKLLKTLPTPACLTSTPAVGDIDGDGSAEIVATVNGHSQYGGDGDSRIMAWKPATAQLLWSIVPKVQGRNDGYGGNFMSPVIADVDGNGSLEVIAANGPAVGIYSGSDGRALTCQEGDCQTNPFTLYAGNTLRSTPAVADVNMDGVLDVIIAGGDSGSRSGILLGWTNLAHAISSPPGAQAPYALPWPMYRGNASHQARY